jgi:hypothetical protein
MTSHLRTTLAATLTVGLLGSGLALAPSALAQSGGGGGVRTGGTCSANGHWNVKAKADDGRLEVEAEVDVNHVGTHWKWRISEDGAVIRSGSATTKAPSGSFSVNRNVANRAGKHRITFRATNPANGNTCHGSLSA